VLNINPGDEKAWCNRGNAYAMLLQWDDVIASYDKALSIDPNYKIAKDQRERVIYFKSLESASPTTQITQQRTPTPTLPSVNRQQTQKAPSIFAYFGVIALIGALTVWRKQK
jgi:tetratricopeptide (TPR) repeat protein